MTIPALSVTCGDSSPKGRAQLVKKRQFSRQEDRRSIIKGSKNHYIGRKNGSIPLPNSDLFEIHGSIFKPDPSRNGGQASVVCVTHCVFLFRIRKDPLNGFFSPGVNSFAQVGLSDVLHNVQVFLPDMCGVYLLPLFIRTAFCFARAMSALRRCASVRSFALPVGSGMS